MTKTLALKPCPWCGPKGQLRLRTEEYCKIRAVSTEDGGEQSSETWHSHGIACAIGLESRVRADCDESPMVLSYLDATHRPRIAVAYTGEGGIQKGKWYKVNDRGEFIPAENNKPGDEQ